MDLENKIVPFFSNPLKQTERWAIHGTITTTSRKAYSLSVCISRNRLLSTSKALCSGYEAIYSIADLLNNGFQVRSGVDKNFFLNFTETGGIPTNNKSHINAEIFRDEYAKSSLPKEVSIFAPPELTPEGLSLIWDNFKIGFLEKSIQLSFSRDEGATLFDNFNLIIPIESPMSQIKISPDLDCFSYPRLQLYGTLGSEMVSGQAWFEYQYGNHAGLQPKNDQFSVTGWNSYKFNFENGDDLWVIQYFNGSDKKPFKNFGNYKRLKGNNILLKDFDILHLQNWISPATDIEYPVEALIKIPEIDAYLTFTPHFRCGEVLVFGPARALWQGTGAVVGKIDGKDVAGHAFCELSGYGYIFDYQKNLQALGARIDTVIEGFFPKKITTETLFKYAGKPRWDYFPDAYNRGLAEPVWDLISRSGKRWRPIFIRHLLGSLGVNPGPYEELLYSMSELNHSGSLIIDDIEDNSRIRRGDECIHIRYGKSLAINAANTLYFIPNLLLFEHPCLDKEQKYEINELISHGFIKGHLGQALDIFWSENMNYTNLMKWMNDSLEGKILQMYSFKTAAGLGGLAETAAIIARAGAEVREACKEYALAFGVAFQIIDDVQNFSDSGTWKKSTGEDLHEGKMTFVLYQSLRMAAEADQKVLGEILSNKELRNDSRHLERGIALVRKSGALEYCRKKAAEIVEPAWGILSGLINTSDQKIRLKILSDYLLNLSEKPNSFP